MPDDTSTPPPSPRLRRHWLVAVGIALLLSGLVWLGSSESGLRLLCTSLVQISAGRLQITAPGGRLLGDWHAEAVRWKDETQDIELEQLALGWSPVELLHGRLAIKRIEAASLRIFSAPGAEPAKLPASLQLPLALRIEHLLLGRLLFGRADENPLALAEGIDAVFDSDGRTHRLERLLAQLGKLTLSADATLSGELPFSIKTQAVLTGAALGQPFSLNLLGNGQLDKLQVDGKIATGTIEDKNSPGSGLPTEKTDKATPVAGASGELHALLTPFSAQPLASLSLLLSRLDPSVFAGSVPQALLDVDAQLSSHPAAQAEPGDTPLSGRFLVTNRSSGALDRQLLPVESLQAQINWQGERLAFDGLVLALAGGGQLKGKGSFTSGQLELDLAAQGVNARALDGRLIPTRLAGPLRAHFGGDTQTLELDLRDALYALSARASLSPDAIELATLKLATGEARLAAQGRLALTGEGQFAAHGNLQNFDPSRFLHVKNTPRSVINAGFELHGALRPALELALHFDLSDSRIGSQKLAGKGNIDLLGNHLRKVDIDLEAAGNRLNAVGAFGRAGDALRLKVMAPKLEALGWPGVAGDAWANIVVGGSVADPEFSGEAQAASLHLGSLLEVRGLSLNAQLGAGAQGALAGLLRCTACALPGYGIPPLAVEVKADGLRSRHHLEARIGLPEKRELRLALDGGLQTESARKPGGALAMLWSGSLGEFRVGRADPASAQPLLQLTAPAPLRVGETAISFGPATIDGLIGNLRIDRLGHEQGRWQSAGRWQQFRPQAMLAEFPSLYARLDALGRANPQPLELAGEWDIAQARMMAGRATLWRESGDLLLGTLPLGLTEARLQATLGEGRLAMSGQLQGSRLGDISAEFNALSARGAVSALIDAQAPWQGRLQARVPDLAWLGPLLGEGWQLAGQLNGEMRLAGSAARPQFSGEWRGEKLALRALDLGMRLERGQALVEITPERLLLRRLSFESDFQTLPRVLALDENIDIIRLTSTPGRVEASGELPFAAGTAGTGARLKLVLDRVGIMQRPDQWLAVSGEGELRLVERVLNVGGKLRVDAGYWSLGQAGRPSLSDDVVILQPLPERSAGRKAASSAAARALHLDLETALGRSFHFRGAGVETRLAGQLRIHSDDAGLPRASGSIRTVDGRFDAYGQKLGIERGIINFQGAIDNPGLNILAVRKNLAVEAGVEVTGTAQRPIIRLVSTPDVPDTEKLSWLVLGHAPDQQGSGDSGLLLAAAQTILGGQDGGVLGKLQQGLGIDEFGVSSGQVGGAGTMPTSRVASTTGFGSSQTVNGQIVSVGKRLSSNALLSYEQSLDTTDSVVKLTVKLCRQFSVVGSAGSESALDFFWNHSFGQ
ncbi:translocation/assembly module TamB domain-containing protein [Propionivibrio sp.]|uniref:translocation/assembly module TamB domain-containing protein n=1 Tax=Propionivibrio sp. TaxID=2212460 RepID=UPI003BF0734A